MPVISRVVSTCADAAILSITLYMTWGIIQEGKKTKTRTILPSMLLKNGDEVPIFIMSTTNLTQTNRFSAIRVSADFTSGISLHNCIIRRILLSLNLIAALLDAFAIAGAPGVGCHTSQWHHAPANPASDHQSPATATTFLKFQQVYAFSHVISRLQSAKIDLIFDSIASHPSYSLISF